MTSFTLAQSWVDQYVASIVLLNVMLGHPNAAPASRPATPESILQTLQEIAHGNYKLDGSSQSSGGAHELILQPPALMPLQIYLVIVLNASTATSDFVNVETGGIVFEDPAWAVFADQAIAQNPRLGIPLAPGNTGMWRRLGNLQEAIHSGEYSSRNFFGAITGFVPSSSPPEFRLMQVTSEHLSALRERGMQSFGKPLQFYQLFQRPTPGH